MKKIVRLVTLLVLCAIPALAEMDEIEVGSFFEYAACDDGVWIHSGGEMSFYDGTGERTSSFTSEGVEHVGARENDLFVHIAQGEAQHIAAISPSGEVHTSWPLPGGFTVALFEAAEEGFVIMGTSKAPAQQSGDHVLGYQDYSLYTLSYDASSPQKLSIPEWENEGLVSFSIDGDVLCVTDWHRGGLTLIDLEKNEVIEVYPALQYDYMVLDNSRGEIYGLMRSAAGGYIECFDLDTGEKRLGQKLPDGAEYMGLIGNGTHLFVEDIAKGRLIIAPIPVFQSADRTLTLIDFLDQPGMPRMEKTLKLFAEDYPNVEIAYKSIDNDEAFTAALMANDPSIDIVCVQEYTRICSKTMMKAGALLDLNESPEIVESLKDWIDLDGIFVEGGVRFGVPQFVNPYFWQVNEALFTETGLSVPEGDWTWADFFALAVKLSAYNQAHGSAYALLADPLNPYILIQYNANYLDIVGGASEYDTPEFRSLMAGWKTAYNDGLILNDPELRLLMPEEYVPALLVIRQGFYGYLSNYRYIMPPRFADDTRFPALTGTLVVNKQSANVDLAVKFLACYLSAETMAEDDYYVTGRFLLDEGMYTGDFKNDPRTFEFAPSSENDKYWEKLLASSAQEAFWGDVMWKQYYDLYPQYIEDKLTVDQLATAFQSLADMALGE